MWVLGILLLVSKVLKKSVYSTVNNTPCNLRRRKHATYLCKMKARLDRPEHAANVYTPANVNVHPRHDQSLNLWTLKLSSPGIDSKESIPPGWESIPGLHIMITNSGSTLCTYIVHCTYIYRSTTEKWKQTYCTEKRYTGTKKTMLSKEVSKQVSKLNAFVISLKGK